MIDVQGSLRLPESFSMTASPRARLTPTSLGRERPHSPGVDSTGLDTRESLVRLNRSSDKTLLASFWLGSDRWMEDQAWGRGP